MAKKKDIKVDVSSMDKDALLKLLEAEWQDHFQTRGQTWKALEIAALLTVAIVGIQWQAPLALVKIVSSVLLIGVSLFGMQITFRHRNSVEKTKFTVITEIEKQLKFKASGFGIPKNITLFDIIKFCKSNTSLFLLRMQGIILILGIIMLAYSIYQSGN
jgi:hypothetical protein